MRLTWARHLVPRFAKVAIRSPPGCISSEAPRVCTRIFVCTENADVTISSPISAN